MEKWFDSSVYMQNKLAQMQATDPAYTMTQLVAERSPRPSTRPA